MPTYSYPDAEELEMIAQQKIPTLVQADPIFEHFPITEKDYDAVIWEQRDNYTGLMQLRGINGQPPKVARVGAKGYRVEPGYYGEFETIDEQELTRRRQWGTFNTPISIDDLVMYAQDQLMSRQFDRIRQILWTLASTGTFSVALPNGNIAHTDTFSLQTYTGSNWSLPATATPLADLRAAALLSLGYSVVFNETATAYMNPVTANYLLANTNTADIGGRRTGGFGTYNTIGEFNTLFTQDGLPNISIYSGSYLNDSGTPVRFIANRIVVIIGRRTDGAPLGSFMMTRNATNPDLGPGAYSIVRDSLEAKDPPPRTIEYHRGFNGGPAIYFPSGIIVMAV